MTAIDTLTCDYPHCGVTIADDLGDGWIKVRTTAYAACDSDALYCAAHGSTDHTLADYEVDGTIDLLANPVY